MTYKERLKIYAQSLLSVAREVDSTVTLRSLVRNKHAAEFRLYNESGDLCSVVEQLRTQLPLLQIVTENNVLTGNDEILVLFDSHHEWNAARESIRKTRGMRMLRLVSAIAVAAAVFLQVRATPDVLKQLVHSMTNTTTHIE